ncbi:fumarate hydratase [Thermoproteus tenax]|uniref:Fumarate hydratase class I, N-terminal domain / tartrate dehydratase alpha subunit n=2 Tax=Thermoproteus tenax TaxID=2271 RepID=G4RLE0_THETK|nr:fumarate hydratase [Thermoproteus tenax]CAF18497.1 tartrate dehydratase alpha subunit/fumarate hydratase class I, N-terminal domain [Thermoproteus tenax]CCC82385.1 fumarate hydratase class I, N-terminal domain / tartrate dehydratase alpha subunit [Thermoproteus tenax Kra 1]
MNLEEVVMRAAKEAITRASISPAFDVVSALRRAREVESSEAARVQIGAILKNVELAASSTAAVCQDTGVPTFFVKLGDGFPIRSKVLAILTEAVRQVTKELPLRPNTTDPFTERNPGDNTGVGVPVFDVELFDGDYLQFTYVPKGGGSELPGKAMVLPPGTALRDLPKIVLEAVVDAGPMPCPPVIVGIGIGPTLDAAAKLAKKAATLRPVGSRNQNPEVAKMEEALLRAINKLGLGAHGVGGDVTALDVHIEYAYRHPATFALAVMFSCWATRRATATVWPDGRYQVA